MVYIEVKFENTSEELNNILVAVLSESHYEGFEEDQAYLKAFIPQYLFDKALLDHLIKTFKTDYFITQLPETNWNNVWESNFQPVSVDDFCAIRADFHETVRHVRHQIVITPKMSFGTGHHATTFMMIRQMKEINFNGKKVLDFGTGTGVLAILAEKLGASTVTAIDNDDWSIANAQENFRKNGAVKIALKKADTAADDKKFDIVLANITRNVILDNFSLFMKHLTDKGILLLSGLLQDDEGLILESAKVHGLSLAKKSIREKWISLKFSK